MRAREGAKAVRVQMDELVGRDITRMLAQVQASSVEEVQAMAERLNAKLEMFPDPQARSWYKMFKHIDEDASGRISYHEFMLMVRRKLRLGVATVSDDALQAVWKAMDEDGSGFVSIGEFGAFMRKGRKGRDGADDGTLALKHEKKVEAMRRRVKHEEELAEDRAARRVAASARQLEREADELERALAAKRKALARLEIEKSATS